MPLPTYTQLITPSSTAAGLTAESVQERILSVLAMLASGTGPDGTTLPTSAGNITLITRTVLAAPAANFDFQSIPQTYENLILELLVAGDDAVNKADRVLIRFNNDSAANYDDASVFGNAAAAGAGNTQAGTSGSLGYMSTAAISAVGVGWLRVTVPGYTRTVFRKHAITHNGATFNVDGSSPAVAESGDAIWRSTAAINRITLIKNTSANFVTGSVASLFGQS